MLEADGTDMTWMEGWTPLWAGRKASQAEEGKASRWDVIDHRAVPLPLSNTGFQTGRIFC